MIVIHGRRDIEIVSELSFVIETLRFFNDAMSRLQNETSAKNLILNNQDSQNVNYFSFTLKIIKEVLKNVLLTTNI